MADYALGCQYYYWKSLLVSIVLDNITSPNGEYRFKTSSDFDSDGNRVVEASVYKGTTLLFEPEVQLPYSASLGNDGTTIVADKTHPTSEGGITHSIKIFDSSGECRFSGELNRGVNGVPMTKQGKFAAFDNGEDIHIIDISKESIITSYTTDYSTIWNLEFRTDEPQILDYYYEYSEDFDKSNSYDSIDIEQITDN